MDGLGLLRLCVAKLRESKRSRVMYNRDLQKKALEDIQKITGCPDYIHIGT